MKTRRTPMASIAAMAAKARVPSRVDRIFLVSCMLSPSASHDRDAGIEGARITRRSAAAARVDRLDVLDEVTDDEARIVARHRVVAVALAGVGEVSALRGPDPKS